MNRDPEQHAPWLLVLLAALLGGALVVLAVRVVVEVWPW